MERNHDRGVNTSWLGPSEVLISSEITRSARTYRCRIHTIHDGLVYATDVAEKVGRGSWSFRTNRAWSTTTIREIRSIDEDDVPA